MLNFLNGVNLHTTAAVEGAMNEMLQSGAVSAAAQVQVGTQGQGPIAGQFDATGVRVRLWRTGDKPGEFPVGLPDGGGG